MATAKKKTNTRAKRVKQTAKRSARPVTIPVAVEPAVTAAQLPSAWAVTKLAARTIGRYWRFFVIYSLVFTVLNILFVHNFASDASSLREQVSSALGGNNATLTSLGTYALLLSSTATGGSGQAAGLWQILLGIIGSLALIWGLRQIAGGESPATLRVRQAYYRGMAPLIPFILVLVVLLLELVPASLGSGLYALAISSSLAVNLAEQILWVVVLIGSLAISLWLLTMSIFAVYIVTLPDMTPLRALKAAKQLVAGKKLAIIRKLLFLSVVLLVVSMILIVPAIAAAPIAAAILFYILGIVLLPIVHTYLYTMYRELLV